MNLQVRGTDPVSAGRPGRFRLQVQARSRHRQGACAGEKIIGRISDRAFGVLVELGLLAAGFSF
jgi:hypothetical protein